ncbi:MAG: lipoyl(octanoyl) transferase LipB [Gemmatimonadetes bacterium]|nr:MAG: lipoyl(octanoyl) transferase LipB [Gemmatimonadota bacterium]
MDYGSEDRTLEARWLGRVPYAEGLELQRIAVERRRAGQIPDQLLLLEHPDVITLGTGADRSHILLSPEQLERRGYQVFETGRGGDVTYHGPGQLVGYPILDLKPDRRDLHRYLRDLEQALISALAHWGVVAARKEGLTGVWIDDRRKIAAIGVRVSSRWITSHGFAFNVATDLTRFGAIVPCGIADHPVTSLSAELGRAVELAEAIPPVREALAAVFQRDLVVV